MINTEIADNSVTLCHKISGRMFSTDFPLKINIHGLKGKNVKDILVPLLQLETYTFTVRKTDLELIFILHASNKNVSYSLILDEVFNPIDLSDIPENLRPLFISLQNRINYLQNKQNDAINELRAQKKEYDDQHRWDYHN